jgi:hypothetical protein
MASAVQIDQTDDFTDVPRIVRGALVLGVIQAVLVLATSLANRGLEGTADAVLTGLFVAIGVAATAFLPAIWIRPRTIEGIAGAAGIGLGAALCFLVIDVILLQPIGTYTNRWWEVGGGSNWWYHPVWWMVSSGMAWLGSFIVANHVRTRGQPALVLAVILVAALAVACGALAAMIGFPGAGWNVATFAVAVLPALALGTIVSGLGGSRR